MNEAQILAALKLEGRVLVEYPRVLTDAEWREVHLKLVELESRYRGDEVWIKLQEWANDTFST